MEIFEIPCANWRGKKIVSDWKQKQKQKKKTEKSFILDALLVFQMRLDSGSKVRNYMLEKLSLSGRRSLLYRNQTIDLQSKSLD